MRPSILLVDDKPENLVALQALLDELGWELVFAASGEEALRAVLHRDFAAIVLDMHMPGMDGAEVASAVRSRARSRNTAILMLTASSGDPEEISRAYTAGAADFITKPVRGEVLVAKLRVFVELYQRGEQIRAQGERLRDAERLERRVEVDRIRRAGERRYQVLADAIPQIVFTADARGKILYWNSRWYDYTGQPEGTRDGLEEALHADDRARCLSEWHHAVATGQLFQVECRLRRADGTYRWFLSRALPERNEAGIVAWIGTHTDIDDARRAAVEREELLTREREARERAERAVQLREEFLQIASHELRTPLTSLRLAIEQLSRERDAEAGTVERRLGLARRQLSRLSGLVESLLDVGRVSNGRLELRPRAMDLGAVAQEVSARFEAELARSRCELKLEVRDGECVGDPDRLDQVVTNLMSNALKYGSGCPIELVVRGDSDAVTLEVRDHGIGIAPGDLERIFERFERAVPTTSYGGLGLGLYISREIVRAHGGTLAAESQPGQGALFRAVIPRSPVAPSGADRSDERAA